MSHEWSCRCARCERDLREAGERLPGERDRCDDDADRRDAETEHDGR